MARLFDRVLAHGLRISMFDLLEASIHSFNSRGNTAAAQKHAARMQNPALIQDVRSIRPRGNGINIEDWEKSIVVSADNVFRYLSEHRLGEDDLLTMLANIAVVPAYDRLFVEARCVGSGMLAGASSFGWSVAREGDGHGGWSMTAGLTLEWRKGHPIGPIALLHWQLDDRGRYVTDNTGYKPVLQAQFPEDPDHPGVLEELCKPLLQSADGTIGALIMTLGMLHCKNVQTSVARPERKQSQRHQRRHGRPMTRYHVLDIRPITRSLEQDGHAKRDGLGAAFHRCRGHFKTFRPDAPLFGKLTGQYWWNAHDRGDKRHGTIKTDYRVHPASGDSVGVVYENKLADLLPSDDLGDVIDTDLSARARTAHNAVQDQLAAVLEAAGITPLRPAPHEPQYDLAWQQDDKLWVVEVKSTTPRNEVRQVRAAIGQVLHYRCDLAAGGRTVHAAVVTEHPVHNQALIDACRAVNITLASPEQFPQLLHKNAD